MSQQPLQAEPRFQLLVTANDKANLLKLLNRVPTTGIDEAKMLLSYVQGIQMAPGYVEEILEEAPTEG